MKNRNNFYIRLGVAELFNCEKIFSPRELAMLAARHVLWVLIEAHLRMKMLNFWKGFNGCWLAKKARHLNRLFWRSPTTFHGLRFIFRHNFFCKHFLLDDSFNLRKHCLFIVPRRISQFSWAIYRKRLIRTWYIQYILSKHFTRLRSFRLPETARLNFLHLFSFSFFSLDITENMKKIENTKLFYSRYNGQSKKERTCVARSPDNNTTLLPARGAMIIDLRTKRTK